MTVNDTLVAFTLLITIITLLVAVLAYWEFSQLRILRKDLQQFQAELRQRAYQTQKAQQRIIASYGLADPRQKISLLQSAIAADPDSFNGYNALGYAYLGLDDPQAAIAAFKEATIRHPDAKEGYFDLAAAYLTLKRVDLCKVALEQAIQHDPTAQADLLADPRFSKLLQSSPPSSQSA